MNIRYHSDCAYMYSHILTPTSSPAGLIEVLRSQRGVSSVFPKIMRGCGAGV